MANVSEVLGTNSIKLRCLYTTYPNDKVSGVNFRAINDSTDTFVDIAESTIFSPQPQLLPYGVYLFGSANITKLSALPSEVVLTFNDLKCKHERSYKCRLSVHNALLTESAPIQIIVRVPPEKPDKVGIMITPMNFSTTTETTIVNTSKLSGTASLYTSTSSEPEPESLYTSTSSGTESVETSTWSGTEGLSTSAPPGMEHSTVIASPRSDIYQTTSLRNVGSTTIDNSITSTTNSFYYSSSGNEPPTVSPTILEGNNITIRCSGNVGKPTGIFIFKKFRKDHTPPIDYNATTTETEKIPENCSYYRTSHLILAVTAEDNQAVIRCVVVSPLAGHDLYTDSEQLEVEYKVRIPTVTKHPDKQKYIVGEDTSLTLSCTSDGNPAPVYRWYKYNLDDNISTDENFTLSNINTTDKGLYTCNVSNTINGLTFTEVTTIEVNIMNEADKTTTESTSTSRSSGANAINGNPSWNVGSIIGGVLGAAVSIIVIIVITYCVYKRRNKISETILQNESESIDGYESKAITESMTGNYDYIALEEDTNKTQTVDKGQEIEDIREHNQEYLKKQEEEEHKKNDSNPLPKPAVYAQVNEATKSKNKENTEILKFSDNQEEGTYAETHEGIYDKAGDRRHKRNENDEHFDTSNISSNQHSNGDNQFQIECYNNQAFEKEENRKITTVSPTIRSSDGFQDDEHTISNYNNQSKEGYGNIISEDQTGTSEEHSSHQTAL
ncbi:Hypothetical predicted protein [Mytilus galloprovincialis]|uniref:Ig-like domain-containing protein n=1 Tax=Mytilus galloprovincialis TaxID=29158 RepID=A0A8B6HEF5_MYTGA|nr:Hypothetical predicted protein [Mytilus galloprovincialis]